MAIIVPAPENFPLPRGENLREIGRYRYNTKKRRILTEFCGARPAAVWAGRRESGVVGVSRRLVGNYKVTPGWLVLS